jgi:hypothetical protein
LSELADQVARRRGLERFEVRQVLAASLLPGATVLSNGLFALARAQNVGCGLITG